MTFLTKGTPLVRNKHLILSITASILALGIFLPVAYSKDENKTDLQERAYEIRQKRIRPSDKTVTVHVQGRICPPEEYPGFDENDSSKFDKSRRLMETKVFEPMKRFVQLKKWGWKEYLPQKPSDERKTYGYSITMLKTRPPLKIVFEKSTGTLLCYIDVPNDSKELFLRTMLALIELNKHIEITVTEPTGFWKDRDTGVLNKWFTAPKRTEKEPKAWTPIREPQAFWLFVGSITIAILVLIWWIYSLWRKKHPIRAEDTLGPIPELPPIKKNKDLPTKTEEKDSKKPDK